MHFKIKHTPTGRVLQLIESYRNAQGQPRDKIVVSLGAADVPVQHYKVIGQIVQQRLYGQTSLLPDTTESVGQWVDYIVRLVERQGRWHGKGRTPDQKPCVDTGASAAELPIAAVVDGVLIDEVDHTNQRELGPSLVGLHAWNHLQIDKELQRLGFNDSQRAAAAISVINRLVDPVSEHGLHEWLATTALPEVLGESVDKPGDDRFYRASDLLHRHREDIEHHVRQRQGTIFDLDRTVLLYDLTNTHFEGMCESNPKAKYGKNKQGRNDCLQVVVGMVFDHEGFELAHKVFEGNRNDGKSLPAMVEELQRIVAKSDPQMIMQADKPLVIMDAGIATDENLSLLRDKGFSYLVNDRRRGRVEFKDAFAQDSEFAVVGGRDGKPEVRVRLIEIGEKKNDAGVITTRKELVVLCKSEPRAAKELAMVSHAEERLVEKLKNLAARIEKGKLKDPKKVNRVIGRIQARSPGIQRHYAIEYTQAKPGAIGVLTWKRNESVLSIKTELAGCYVLRTDREHLSADELWHLYISLTRAEDGFRSLKSVLGLRPNFHQLEHRVDAHVFITILAYQLLCYIQHSLEKTGDYRCWDTIKRVLQTHSYTTIILPTKNGSVYRIRKPGIPDQRQQAIYDALGVRLSDLPKTTTVFEPKPEAIL